MTTLDLIEQSAWPPPFGLKLDAEGAELEILRGARETLTKCEFVIAEVSVLPRFEGGYAFAEFVAAMDEAGFAARDFLGIGRAPSGDVTFTDLLFRRKEESRLPL